MKNKVNLLLVIVYSLICLTLPGLSWARSNLDKRLQRLENIIANQVSVDMLNQLESLQQELRELQGKLEGQEHAIQLLNQQQEQLARNNNKKSSVKNTEDNVNADKQQPVKSRASEQELYNSAYKLMNDKKYSAALVAFNDLLWQYPKGHYVPNVHYWLGEIYLLQWSTEPKDDKLLAHAIGAFKQVTQDFRNHQKAVDSLLKLGLIEIDRENWQAAKAFLEQLRVEYPDSSRAKIAQARLEQLKQAGHI